MRKNHLLASRRTVLLYVWLLSMFSCRSSLAQDITIALSPSGNGTAFTEKLLKLNLADFTNKFRVTVSGIPSTSKEDDVLILKRNGSEIERKKLTAANAGKTSVTWDPVTLAAIQNQGPVNLSVTYQPLDAKQISIQGKPIAVKLDTVGPILNTIQLTGIPESGLTLLLRFEDDDLEGTTLTASDNLKVYPLDASGRPVTGTNLVKSNNVYIDGTNVVRIFLGVIQVGSYELIVGTGVTDVAANPAGGGDGREQKRQFSSEPSPEQGPRVEFPEFLPTAKQPETDRRANPGDRVETRVARLYYFRDAHRVAQIINRVTQSYNRAAVTQAQRRAEDARVRAEELIDARRASERAAIEAAQATRRKERELSNVYQQIQKLQQEESRLEPGFRDRQRHRGDIGKCGFGRSGDC